MWRTTVRARCNVQATRRRHEGSAHDAAGLSEDVSAAAARTRTVHEVTVDDLVAIVGLERVTLEEFATSDAQYIH